MASKDQMRYRKTYSYYRVQPRTQELEIIADESLDWKHSVRAASTGDVTLTGSTPLTVDGVTLAAGERVLLKDQGTGSQNGIYYVEISGGSYTLTRDTDAVQGTLTCGATTYTEEGTTQSGTIWILSTYNPLTIGSTSLAWTQFSGGGGGGGGGESYWFSNIADEIYTTGSVGIGTTVLVGVGSDVYFYVSGSITGSGADDNKAVFGGDVVMSGSLEIAGDQVEITGSLYVSGDVMEVTGTLTVTGGISGSLTTLADGTSYLVAGTNITIVSQSNGSIEISSTGGGGGGGSSYWFEQSYEKIYTTGSVGIGTAVDIDHRLVVAGSDAMINGLSVGVGPSYDNVMIVRDSSVTSSMTTKSIVIGYEAAKNSTGGYLNTAIGYWAGYSLSPGSGYNTLIGDYAGMNTTSGSSNVAIGGALGQNRAGNGIVAIGPASLTSWNGSEIPSIVFYPKNVAVGQSSLENSLEGRRNTAIGWGAGVYLQTGDDNTIVGSESLWGSAYTTGNKNTVVGSRVLFSASNASSNVAVGYEAGEASTTGNYNTFLGTSTNPSSPSDSNSIVIGYGAVGLGSNTTVLGNGSTVLTSIPSGSVGIGTWSVSNIGTDVFLFVSGSSGSLGTSTRGVAAFGGDVIVSGSLKVGTGSVLLTSNDIQFGTSGMRIEKNGNDMKFFDPNNTGGKTLSDLAAGGGGGSGPTYWSSPSAGFVYATGSVGIGASTVDSSYKLNVYQTANVDDLRVKIEQAGADYGSKLLLVGGKYLTYGATQNGISSHYRDEFEDLQQLWRIWGGLSTDTMVFDTGASEAMRIDANRNVGIGTTTISARLNVHSANGGTGLIVRQGATAPVNATPIIHAKDYNGNPVLFVSGSTGSGARVGIGTDNPRITCLLDVGIKGGTGTNNYVSVNAGSTGECGFSWSSSGADGIWKFKRAASTSNLSLVEAGGSNIALLCQYSTGNVGINTDNPSEKLHVNTGNIKVDTSGYGVRLASSPSNADAQTLDAYYEVTVTSVALRDDNGDYVMAPGYDRLKMTRIGRLVTIAGNLRLDSEIKPSGSGRLKINMTSSSPVPPLASNKTAASVWITSFTSGLTYPIQAYMDTVDSVIYVDAFNAGAYVNLGPYLDTGADVIVSVTYVAA